MERGARDVTARRFDRPSDPGRLSELSSSHRWDWWQEAAGAAWDRPLTGHGAGSFPLLHALYREHDVEVRRITLSNHGKRIREIEVTSYVEVVLAKPDQEVAADCLVEEMFRGADREEATADAEYEISVILGFDYADRQGG